MVEGITIQASPAACPRPCPGLSGGQDQSTLGLGARASRPLWSGHLAHAGPATRDLGPAPRDWGKGLALPLGFVHFALTAKYQLTTALARLRERGDAKRWVRDSLICHEANKPSPPASPYPLPSERAVISCGPAVSPNVETPGSRNAGPPSPAARGAGGKRFSETLS